MFKQSLAALIALLGLNSLALAQTAAPQPAGAGTPAKCAPPAIAGQTMDLEQVPGTNLMTVPVEINGTPKRFLLDIGSDPDTVAQTTVAVLHLPYFDKNLPSNAMADQNTPFQFNAAVVDVKSASAQSRLSNQDLVRVASYGIAGATTENLQLPVTRDDRMGKSEPYDGLFTANLFPQYDLNFDFGGKKLNFLTATSCTDPNQVAYWPHQVVATIPMTTANGKMRVPVTIQGHQVDAIVDFGSDHTVMRREFAERTFGLDTDKDMTPDGDRRDGMGQRIYVHTFPQISFGGVIANNVPARIQSNSMVRNLNRTPTLGSRATFNVDPGERIPDLALGMDVLHQLHLYAAFGESKLYATPAQ